MNLMELVMQLPLWENISHPCTTLEAELGSLAGKAEREKKAKHPRATDSEKENVKEPH